MHPVQDRKELKLPHHEWRGVIYFALILIFALLVGLWAFGAA